MAKIELRHITHSYTRGEYAVKDINLTWEDGVASALVGPSGCGKTTMLKIISGLLKPSGGRILLDGVDVTNKLPRERNIAPVFQFPVVYETLNVFDNLAFPLRNRGVPAAEIKQRVYEVAEMLELQDVLNRNAGRLGAAEKQRISMGRGVVRSDTAALLLDEPLTVIDPHQKWHIRRKLKELHSRTGVTMIYVTHDQHEALTFADQVTVMDKGEVLQTGTPQELHEYPQAPFVGYFIGSPGMNVFPAVLQGERVMVGRYKITLSIADLALTQVENTTFQLGIRPEYVQTCREPQPGWFECTVISVNRTSNVQIVELRGEGLTFKVRIGQDAAIQPAQTMWANFPPARTILYANNRAIPLREDAIETGGTP
jgi:glycerol transport system ATP-binding protein